MSDAKSREPQSAGAQAAPASAAKIESVDSAFAAAVETEQPPAEPMNLAVSAPVPETPRASGLSHALFLLGGVGLAMLGGLMLRGNDDAGAGIAALRRDSEAAASQSEARLKAAEARADAAGKALDGQAKALAALEKRTKDTELALAAKPAAVAAPDMSGVAALETRVGGLAGKVSAIELVLAAPKTPLQATEVKIAPPPPATGNMAAQLVLAQGVQGALERGAPFEAEVAALQNLGVDAARLAPLAALAAKGAPSQASLIAEWKKLAPALASATAPEPAKSQNWMEQITNGAASLVTVRRDGDAPVDTAGAAIAGVDAALAGGSTAALETAFAKLPAKAQELAKEWLAAMKNRNAAVETARALAADAIAQLAAKKP